MDRMKTFGKYILIGILFYIFSEIMIYCAITSSYKTIQQGTIINSDTKIEVMEAKATYINGYIEGKVTNDTDKYMSEKYIKVDCYSERGVNLGKKYLKIENLKPKETREFKIGFRFKDVDSFKLECIDNKENASDEELITDEMIQAFFLGFLIKLMIF